MTGHSQPKHRQPDQTTPGRPRIVAMVQLPPPMHGAAMMNRHALDAMARIADLNVIEMRFSRQVSDLARPSWRKAVLACWLLVKLLLALPRCDVFYICFAPTGAAYYRDCCYVLIARLFRVSAILHLHGRGLPAMRQGPWRRWLQKHVFAGQTVILLGKALLQEVSGLQCTCAIIANALPDAAFAPLDQAPWRPSDPVRILWLSNLFAAKGIETVIAACARLKDRAMDCRLTIAGAAGDVTRSDLDAMLEKYGMTDAATCLGPVTAARRQALLAEHDIFVLPSNYANEAQPLAVIEAMAAGLPVITSDIATLPEFVIPGQTGRSCTPDDADALAQAITDAVTAPAGTTRLRDNAWYLCNRKFRLERFRADITALIARTAKGRGQSASQSARHRAR